MADCKRYKVAAIDLGTVSSRLVLAQVEGGAIVESSKHTEITDLGEGVDATGRFCEAAVERVLAACRMFVDEARAFGAACICTTCTSAARDASNAALLLDGLRDLGLEPQVIPGEVEARLTFFGVAHDFAGERIIVADSGGGSTELATGVYAPERGVFALEGTRSLDIGCRRVTERFFSALPPSCGELAAAAAWAGEQFAAYFEGLPSDFERAERLVAVGGTVTTLVALVHELEPYDSSFVHLRELSLEQVSAAIERMSVLDSEGIAFFGVANVGEARRISQAGCRTRPYILGPAFPEEREEIVLNGWRSFISTMEEAEHYNSLARLYGKTLPIHLSVDTGMGRGGFLPDQLEELLSRLGELDSLYPEGLGAHLPCADEDREITLRQIALFERMAARIREKLPLKYCHLANSAASLDYEIPSNNMCRPGLVLYGFSPIDSPWASQLRPAMALFSRLTVVRTLPEGHGISYGGTYVTDHPTRVATVGIGYADGYLRSLAHKGARVMVDGVSCPLLGRVTMDQIIVDVSRAPHAEPGMTAEIMGPHIPVTELAEKAGTISWEIFTGIGPRVPRGRSPSFRVEPSFPIDGHPEISFI